MVGLGVSRENLVDWLRELIKIPSITGSEGEVSEYVARQGEKLGYEVKVVKDNVFFETKGVGRKLLLNAHLDTVDVGEGWSRDPFGAEIDGGEMYGRGASDDKGNIAAMLEIARIIREDVLKGSVIFTFTTGEEFGVKYEDKGSYILSEMLKADRALVLEPQMGVRERKMDVVYGCRGVENFLFHIRGKASHTGYPERGMNAILQAAEFITKLRRSNYHQVESLGKVIKTVVMPIKIEGGEERFVVPDRCNVLVHSRTAPGDEKLHHMLQEACRSICQEQFEVEHTYSALGYLSDAEDQLVETICNEAKRHGYGGALNVAGGRIDASIFTNVGKIPSYCTGVGNKDQMHMANEYITIENFIIGTEILRKTVQSYLSV